MSTKNVVFQSGFLYIEDEIIVPVKSISGITIISNSQTEMSGLPQEAIEDIEAILSNVEGVKVPETMQAIMDDSTELEISMVCIEYDDTEHFIMTDSLEEAKALHKKIAETIVLI